MSDWHKAMSGASGERKIMERIDEVKFGMEYAESQGVPYDRAFPPAAGATYQTDPDEEDPENPKEQPAASS
jgi:hypothetical protein